MSSEPSRQVRAFVYRAFSAARERHSITWMSLSAIWALELFLVQELTLHPGWTMRWHGILASRLVRLLLDCLTCLTVTGFASRFGLYSVWLLWSFTAVGLLTYSDYFGHALGLSTLVSQWAEGLAAWRAAVLEVQPRHVVLVAFFLSLKLFVAETRHFRPLRHRNTLVLGSLSYLLVFSLSNLWIDPLRSFRTYGTVDRLGETYGYLLSWAGEAWFLKDEVLLQRAMHNSSIETDRLRRAEADIQATGDVVIIQVESLGVAVLQEQTPDGEAVMPFLSELIHTSMYFAVRPAHINGSADADFVFLTSRLPSPDVVTYKLRDYDYSRSLPRIAMRCWYAATALHGTTGDFFSRRQAFAKMGFERLVFQEEIEPLLQKRYSQLAVAGVHDHELFALSIKLLQEEEDQKSLHFIITLSSHSPFEQASSFVRPALSVAPSKRQNYLNSMRYVDDSLRTYVQSLGNGTTVMIYGDHGVPSLYDGADQLVPFVIHQKGSNLALGQTTRASSIAYDGSLSLQDAVKYVWRMVAGCEDPISHGSNEGSRDRAAPDGAGTRPR